jgi:hypothetical protein
MPTSRVDLTDAIVTAIEPPEMSELFVWDSVCAGRAVRSSVRSWPVAITEPRELSGRLCSEAASQTSNSTLQREIRTSARATDVPGPGGQPLRCASWRRSVDKIYSQSLKRPVRALRWSAISLIP